MSQDSAQTGQQSVSSSDELKEFQQRTDGFQIHYIEVQDERSQERQRKCGAARRALFLFSGLTYLYFVVMLVLLLQLLYLTLLKSSVDEFAGSILTHVDHASFVAWGFILLSIAHFIVLSYQAKGSESSNSTFMSCQRADLLSRVVGNCRRLKFWLLVMPPVLMSVVLYFGASQCIIHGHKYASGGHCQCESRYRRPLLSADGHLQYEVSGEPEEVKIAFVGDVGGDSKFPHIYQLIQKEHVSAVVLNGDLDYLAGKEDHKAWRDSYQAHLGNVPFFITAGNHDTATFVGYQEETKKHWDESNVTECSGTIGVKNKCTHKGVGLLLSGAGSSCGGPPEEHEDFVKGTLEEFSDNNIPWRICVFHHNQKSFQTGNKGDAVGWNNYHACLRHGAIIIASHEHAYARTHVVKFQPPDWNIEIAHPHLINNSGAAKVENAYTLSDNSTLVVLTGIGGHSIRNGNADMMKKDYWAAYRNKDEVKPKEPGGKKENDIAEAGVFFCTFNKKIDKSTRADPSLAHCFFKDLAGKRDEFWLRWKAPRLHAPSPPPPTSEAKVSTKL